MLEADPELLARQAQVAGELGNLAHALTLFERAVARQLEQRDRGGATDTLRLMAGLLEQAGEFARAREALTRAIELVPGR